MGLDCLWRNNENKTASVDKEFKVCGGMCSDNGTTSFRGKVYNDLIEQASKISLYQEKIDNDTCRKILECLENFNIKNYKESCWRITNHEFEELKAMFKAHVEKGHHLVGWW